jgi:hypothetical protein
VNRMVPTIELSSISWTDTDGDASRLLTTVLVTGCNPHLEAFAIESIGGIQTSSARDHDLAAIRAAVGAQGPWETCSINDRDYVLIATPYSR